MKVIELGEFAKFTLNELGKFDKFNNIRVIELGEFAKFIKLVILCCVVVVSHFQMLHVIIISSIALYIIYQSCIQYVCCYIIVIFSMSIYIYSGYAYACVCLFVHMCVIYECLVHIDMYILLKQDLVHMCI